jgi:hypothetical protein
MKITLINFLAKHPFTDTHTHTHTHTHTNKHTHTQTNKHTHARTRTHTHTHPHTHTHTHKYTHCNRLNNANVLFSSSSVIPRLDDHNTKRDVANPHGVLLLRANLPTHWLYGATRKAVGRWELRVLTCGMLNTKK